MNYVMTIKIKKKPSLSEVLAKEAEYNYRHEISRMRERMIAEQREARRLQEAHLQQLADSDDEADQGDAWGSGINFEELDDGTDEDDNETGYY